MQLYNIIFDIFCGGRSPQRQKSSVALVAQNSVPPRRGGPGVPGAQSYRPLGGSAGQARADPAYEAKLLGKAARPRPPWLGLQSPYPTPCPMSSPQSPPPSQCPRSPGLRKGVFRFLAKPSFLFFSKWTRSGCYWKGTWGPDMGQGIPAMLMGSAAEGGGAGRPHWAPGSGGGPLFLTPARPPNRLGQGLLLLLSDLLGFSSLICETDGGRFHSACPPAKGIQARQMGAERALSAVKTPQPSAR